MFEFRKFDGPETLKPYVKSIWYLRAFNNPTPPELLIVPDGFPEIAIHYETPYIWKFGDGRKVNLHQDSIIGQLRSSITLTAEPGARTLCFKLYPWVLAMLMDISLSKITDKPISLDQIPGLEGLGNLVRSTSNLNEAIEHFERLFFERLKKVNKEEYIIQHIVGAMIETSGLVPLESLMTKVRFSRRYLEKLFKKSIGMSPAAYMKILRIKEISRRIASGEYDNYAQLTHSLGYCDQSHFSKDFCKRTGFSPKAYAQYMKTFPLTAREQYLNQFKHDTAGSIPQ